MSVTARQIAAALFADAMGSDFPIQFSDLELKDQVFWLEHGRDGVEWLQRCQTFRGVPGTETQDG
jgi:hypothetical protein